MRGPGVARVYGGLVASLPGTAPRGSELNQFAKNVINAAPARDGSARFAADPVGNALGNCRDAPSMGASGAADRARNIKV